MKHLFLSHLKVFSYKNSTNGMTDRVLCSNYQGISSMTKSKTAVGKDSRKTCNMSFTLRIWITTFLCLLSLHGKGMITISAITGTSCIISWKTIADTENYYVIVGEVVEPFAQTYNTNSQNGDQEACLQALEDMGIEYSSVTPFYLLPGILCRWYMFGRLTSTRIYKITGTTPRWLIPYFYFGICICSRYVRIALYLRKYS